MEWYFKAFVRWGFELSEIDAHCRLLEDIFKYDDIADCFLGVPGPVRSIACLVVDQLIQIIQILQGSAIFTCSSGSHGNRVAFLIIL